MHALPLILPAILAPSSAAPLGTAEPAPSPEYTVKAKIIRLLLEFVEWPNGGERPIVLGVLEPSPFGDSLAKLLENAVVKGRPVQLRPVGRLSQMDGCDAVFIPEGYDDRLDGVLKSLRGRPVLTLSDTPGFGHRGVAVNMVVHEGRTRLEVNLPAMKASGVTISPQLLKGATVIH